MADVTVVSNHPVRAVLRAHEGLDAHPASGGPARPHRQWGGPIQERRPRGIVLIWLPGRSAPAYFDVEGSGDARGLIAISWRWVVQVFRGVVTARPHTWSGSKRFVVHPVVAENMAFLSSWGVSDCVLRRRERVGSVQATGPWRCSMVRSNTGDFLRFAFLEHGCLALARQPWRGSRSGSKPGSRLWQKMLDERLADCPCRGCSRTDHLGFGQGREPPDRFRRKGLVAAVSSCASYLAVV